MNKEFPKEIHGSKFHNAMTQWRAEYVRMVEELARREKAEKESK